MIPADPHPHLPKSVKKAVAATTKPGQPVDWTSVLGYYGMPKDLVDRIGQIWKSAGPAPNLAELTPIIVGTVRGSDWYAKTFPGIQQGINAGLFGDEQGYRSYQNQLTQIYRQYHDRPVTPGEVAKFAQAGQSVSQVGASLRSQAIAGSLTDPLKSLFSPQELKAFADEQAGIDTALGQRISNEADLALRVDSMYTDFYGRGVTRGELNRLTKNGTSSDDVAKEFATQSNINAMDPAVSHLFTPEEIRQIALQKAGGTTQDGGLLAAQAQLAQTLNPIFHQYTGQGVSRQDVVAAHQSGESPEAIRARFAGGAFVDANRGDIQQALGSFGEGQISEGELQSLGQNAVGYDNPTGQRLAVALEKAQRRFAKVSRGVLSSPSLALLNGRPAGSRKAPDTGA